jgi:4-hydroxy-2-oxoheptanedioate aldolase
MRHNKLLDAVRSGKPAFGPELWTGSPVLIELMGQFPFRWVGIDVEHSPYASYETVEHLCRAADMAGLTPIVSIPEFNSTHIAKLCESGVMGFIVAHTITAEDADRAVQAAKYPPLGTRSAATAVRQTGYALNASGWADTADALNDQIVVIGKIEDIDALDNLDGILSTGIDGLTVGSFDLSHSIASAIDLPEMRGNVLHPKVIEARDRVFAKCQEHGKFGAGVVQQLAAQEGKSARETVNNLLPKGVLVYALTHELAFLGGCYQQFFRDMEDVS